MLKNSWLGVVAIIILVVVAGLLAWPSEPNWKIFGWSPRNMEVQLGLDLQGGSHLLFGADMSDISEENQPAAKEGLIDVIRNRIDILGVKEPIVQSATIGDQPAVIVELPGIQDVKEATSLIGETAQLKFLEQKEETGKKSKKAEETILTPNFKPTKLTGGRLEEADVDVQNGKPVVTLRFNKEGTKLFADITKRNLNKPVAISLDSNIISAPTVNSIIKDGQAIIEGGFTPEEAQLLKKKLNAGALPVPLELVEQRTVGPTLGQGILKDTILAGLIGLILLIVFMIAYYRFAGLIAAIALIIYSLLALAIYKIIPVTMSLAGIAGFILSIGMAVDANILIFERSKEELKAGKPETSAIEDGFSRAWPSIRDSNISSIITALVLFYFGSGLIKGFALTLGIGVLISMFTAITVSRNFWLSFINLKGQREEK
jgi:preprotein translocase subunit SecD